jgi:hypothetical protein
MQPTSSFWLKARCIQTTRAIRSLAALHAHRLLTSDTQRGVAYSNSPLNSRKCVPDAATVAIGPAALPSAPSAAAATQIAQQIIYGNFTSIAATGDGATIQVAVAPHAVKSLAQFLTGAGMAEEDGKELARLAASEKPESAKEPMGPQVRSWLVENLKKAASGTWTTGIAVATDVVKEALLKYYGLK